MTKTHFIIYLTLFCSTQANKQSSVYLMTLLDDDSGFCMSRMRFLRNKDRDCHRDCYPMLLYPECYLLEGGYRAFFKAHPELCQPCGYRSMVDPHHTADLKHFRLKSRSWPVPSTEEGSRLRRARSCLKL